MIFGISGGGVGKRTMTSEEKNDTGIFEDLSEAKMQEALPEQERPQKFLKNDRYFTICIYTFVLVVACTVAIKAIISFDQTRAFLYTLLRALGPFLIAILIAYVLRPFVEAAYKLTSRLLHYRHPRPAMVLAMLLVYLVAIGMIISLLVYVLPEVVRNLMDMITKIPDGYQQLLSFAETLQERFPQVDLSSVVSMLESTQSDLVSSLTNATREIIPVLYTASVSVVTWFANFVIAIVVSVYMLYGKASLKRLCKIIVYTFIPKESIPTVREVLVDCNRIFSKYVVSKMIDSLIIGVLCAILMTILRLPYVFLISVVVGVTNMIPYFGPFIGAIPGAVIELVISPVKALIFLIMILCLQQFDGLFLGPKLMGSSTGMKPLWIIFAITLGGKFFGVIGMFLGVPVLAILAYLGERLAARRLRRKQMKIEEIS